jgi:glycosyltransferase involved in cell wall biosynthesis
MFVWNTFTNDARVLRECTALAESGYEVDLIAIHDPKDEQSKKSEKKNGFNITRVDRYPKLLLLLKRNYGRVKRRKYIYYPLIVLLAFITTMLIINTPFFAIIFISCMLFLKYIKFPRLWINSSIICKMIKEGRRKDYDIYHSNDLNTLPQGWMCAKVLSSRKKKLVYDSHEVQTSRTGYGKNVYFIEKFFITKVDSIINENQTRAEYTRNLYKIDIPHVVHNYPFYQEVDKLKKIDLYEILKIDRSEPILLYQGGIQSGRGLDKLIEAAPMFKRGVLVFIGDGRIKEELIKKVSGNESINKIKFLSKVPVEELPYYTVNAYLGFQVLNNICFNHYSASSNKLFEYIMAEVPVVACSFPEIERVIKESDIGIGVDSHDPVSIAKGVNRLLDDIELRNKFSENCRKAKLKYNWENEKELFLKVYSTLL